MGDIKEMKWLRLLLVSFFLYAIVHTAASAQMIKRKQIEPTGQVVWEVPTRQKVIALTFDDGPNPIYTPQILHTLNKYKAHATFFSIGYKMKRYPHIVRQVVRAGHELGNHSMTHQYENKAGVQRMRIELLQAERVIKNYQQNHIKFFRPPGGYIDRALLHEANKQGYKVILWSYHQDSKDWSKPGAKAIADHIIRHAKSGNIVLLHDGGGNRSQTVRALKTILPALKKQGFQFVTVSELLQFSNQNDQKY
jgi:peptidoglycan-N-acetylglucosamine deacetylase